MPCAEEQRRRRDFQERRSVRCRCLCKLLAHRALHERLVLGLQQTVAKNRIIDAVRGVKRCDLGDAIELCAGEIDQDVRNEDAGADCAKQALLETIGLALHAVNQHTPDLAGVRPGCLPFLVVIRPICLLFLIAKLEAAPLEDMPGTGVRPSPG